MTKTLYEPCPLCSGPHALEPQDGCACCHGERYVPAAQVQPCEDHAILDAIADAMNVTREGRRWKVERMDECLEFTDFTAVKVGGRRFEVVVREIEARDEEETKPWA